MKVKSVFVLTVLLLCLTDAWAQSWQQTSQGIRSVISDLNIEIQFYSPSVVRVIKFPSSGKFDKESLSVTARPQKTVFTVKQDGNLLKVRNGNIQVQLNLGSGALAYYTGSGEPLLREKEGSAVFTPFDDAGNNTFNVQQSFLLDRDEAIYGLGQQQKGKMIQRNLRLHMVQGNTDDYIPFFQSVKGYGLFWDNYAPTQFADNPDSTVFRSEVGDGIDYYFMYGGNADGVIACMRELTGKVPMFPLWTFGFWQSKERYKSQDELVGVVKKYRELEVPLDGIIQDWQYWGNNYLWNAMEFLNSEFYDPQKMVDDIHHQHAHMIISIWNSFGPHTKQFKELEKIQALMDFRTWPESGSEKWPPNPAYPSGVKVYDPYNPAARDIYWRHLNAGLFSIGIDGWWMDSSEPDHLQAKPSDFNNKTFLGSFRKVRNAFPLMTVGGVYDRQRSVSSGKRVFILTRSAFAGQQRYGANTWSGDVFASWNTLRNQIPAGLNFSLCGIPYWNSDIGGFFLNAFPRKLQDPEYRELYVRWLQFGTFCPMMRSHGADAPREIYQFGKKGDKNYDAIEKFIRLRYSLLPYLYATSWEVTANHSSMMRALVMDFANDKNALDINDQFMLGKSLLVHPVTRAMYVKKTLVGKDSLMVEDFDSIKMQETYLPAGCDWYDLWTSEKFTGGQKVARATPIDIIPVYVRAGSILPVGPDVQYAEEKKWNDLEIRIYAGADGKFVLYEDENDNYNYEKGIHSTIRLQWNNKKRTLIIGDREGAFPGMSDSRRFRVVLIETTPGTSNVLTTKPGRVIDYSGKQLTIKL